MRRLEKWANITVGIVIVFIFAYLYLRVFGRGRLYWSYVNETTFNFVDKAVDFAPFMAIATLIGWSILQFFQQTYKRNVVLLIFSVMGTIFLTALLLVVNFNVFLERKPSQLQELAVANHIYRLAYFPPFGSGGPDYEMFECDSLGILCDEIHSLRVEEDFPDTTDYPQLVFEPDQASIVLMQYGNTVYEQKVA